MNVNLSPCERS